MNREIAWFGMGFAVGALFAKIWLAEMGLLSAAEAMVWLQILGFVIVFGGLLCPDELERFEE